MVVSKYYQKKEPRKTWFLIIVIAMKYYRYLF